MRERMKENAVYIGVITSLLLFSLIGFTKQIHWLIYSSLMASAYIIFVVWNERRKYVKELTQISKIIDQMLNQDKITSLSLTSEYLSSKIQHQIDKLHTIFINKQFKIQKDRDEVRLLIVDIAHQLRNPLANMRLYLDLLQSDNITKDEQNNYLENLEQSLHTITFLTESFIKMSRLESKVIQLKLNNGSLDKTIKKAIDSIQPIAIEKQIKIIYTKPTEEIEMMHDSNWMYEAIYNLLDNAVKYSNIQGTIEVSVVQNEMFQQIIISNDGITIQSGEENEIFKRFYRGKNITNQKGFGIGLYITRSIILLHNGFIKVNTREQRTIFTINLPR